MDHPAIITGIIAAIFAGVVAFAKVFLSHMAKTKEPQVVAATAAPAVAAAAVAPMNPPSPPLGPAALGSRATSSTGRDPANARRTASSLNSWLNRRRLVLIPEHLRAHSQALHGVHEIGATPTRARTNDYRARATLCAAFLAQSAWRSGRQSTMQHHCSAPLSLGRSFRERLI